jgi:uracil-DNA glycosylase family 4
MPKVAKPPLKCPLTGPPVYPDVPKGADILFIGMNPGKLEEEQHRPFVGPSGRMLRRWLMKVGLLERAAFANIELHRTWDLDEAGRKINLNREPTSIEVRACRPVLLRTIHHMQPMVIVCVGGSAAWEFGYKGSVGKMVGKFTLWKAPRNAVYQPEYLTTVIFHPGGFLGKGLEMKERARREQAVMDTLEQVKKRVEEWWS